MKRVNSGVIVTRRRINKEEEEEDGMREGNEDTERETVTSLRFHKSRFRQGIL